MSIADSRNNESHSIAMPFAVKTSEDELRREIAANMPADAFADLVRDASERGILVSEAYHEECERRRRIEAQTPTEEQLAAAPSPPPAEWYKERW